MKTVLVLLYIELVTVVAGFSFCCDFISDNARYALVNLCFINFTILAAFKWLKVKGYRDKDIFPVISWLLVSSEISFLGIFIYEYLKHVS